MELVIPSQKHQNTFLDAISEFEDEGDQGFWRFSDYMPDTIEAYIERILNHSKGIDLPPNWVPSTTYWLIDGDEFIGHINIRHELNDFLLNIGGHIGYSIRPSKRRQGYGTKMLGLALPKAKKIGLTRALITCDNNNVPSLKIIERNNGILEGEFEQKGDLPSKMRFWIEL